MNLRPQKPNEFKTAKKHSPAKTTDPEARAADPTDPRQPSSPGPPSSDRRYQDGGAGGGKFEPGSARLRPDGLRRGIRFARSGASRRSEIWALPKSAKADGGPGGTRTPNQSVMSGRL